LPVVLAYGQAVASDSYNKGLSGYYNEQRDWTDNEIYQTRRSVDIVSGIDVDPTAIIGQFAKGATNRA